MNKVYQKWYKCIGDDANNETVRLEAEIEIEIGGWDMQRHKSLLYLIRELELDK